MQNQLRKQQKRGFVDRKLSEVSGNIKVNKKTVPLKFGEDDEEYSCPPIFMILANIS